MLGRWLRRRRGSDDSTSTSEQPPQIDVDVVMREVFESMESDFVGWNEAGRPGTPPSSVSPLGSLSTQEDEDAASLAAADRILRGEEPEPTAGSMLSQPLGRLTDREEAFSQRTFEEHQGAFTSRVPFRRYLLSRVVFGVRGGWTDEEYAVYEQLMTDLDRAAETADLTAPEIPESVRLAAGRVYRFFAAANCV